MSPSKSRNYRDYLVTSNIVIHFIKGHICVIYTAVQSQIKSVNFQVKYFKANQTKGDMFILENL